jgi:hypothetical protein
MELRKVLCGTVFACAASLFIQGCATVPIVSQAPVRRMDLDAEIKQGFVEVLEGMRAEFSPPPPPAPVIVPAPVSPVASASSGGSAPVQLYTQDGHAAAPVPLSPLSTKGGTVRTKSIDSDAAVVSSAPSLSSSKAPMMQPETPSAEKKSLPSAKTLAEALKKAGVTASFTDDVARNISATSLFIKYETHAELAREIESSTGLFCIEDSAGCLVISSLKEETYEIGQSFEKHFENNVGKLLHDEKAEANILDGTGQMVVRDDRTGHGRIKEALNRVRADHFTAYRFTISVEKAASSWGYGKKGPVTAASGEITPSTSPLSMGEWGVAIKRQGAQLFVETLNPRIMEAPASFVMDADSGGTKTFTINRNGKEERYILTVTRS